MKPTTPTNPEMSPLSGAFTAFLCMLFGANAVAIKISFTGLGPFTTAGIRFLVAAVAISLWARMTGRPFRVPWDRIPGVLLLGAIFTVQLSLFHLGLNKTYASRGVLIANLLPFLVLFLSHFLIPGDRITVKKCVGIFMGFGGVALMYLDGNSVSGDLRSGDLIVFAAVILWSIGAVYTKKIIAAFQPFPLVLYPMFIAVPFFFLEGYLFDPVMIADLNARVIGALIYQSFVTASFGFVAWNTMLKRYGASTLHTFVVIMPISGVIFGGWLLKEPVTTGIIAAGALIAFGILVVNLRPRRPTPPLPLDRGI